MARYCIPVEADLELTRLRDSDVIGACARVRKIQGVKKMAMAVAATDASHWH